MSTPSRTRRAPAQERSRRTVRQILDATEELIGERGIDAATTRAIAERAGVAVPSLYRFFADRDEILDALLEHMVADLDAHARAAEAVWTPGDVEDLIRLQLELHAGYYERHPTLAALWFGGRASPAVVASVRRRNTDLAKRVRALLLDHGLIGEEAPLPVFTFVTELGDRVLQVAFRDGSTADREALALGVTALTAFIERAVAP